MSRLRAGYRSSAGARVSPSDVIIVGVPVQRRLTLLTALNNERRNPGFRIEDRQALLPVRSATLRVLSLRGRSRRSRNRNSTVGAWAMLSHERKRRGTAWPRSSRGYAGLQRSNPRLATAIGDALSPTSTRLPAQSSAEQEWRAVQQQQQQPMLTSADADADAGAGVLDDDAEFADGDRSAMFTPRSDRWTIWATAHADRSWCGRAARPSWQQVPAEFAPLCPGWHETKQWFDRKMTDWWQICLRWSNMRAGHDGRTKRRFVSGIYFLYAVCAWWTEQLQVVQTQLILKSVSTRLS